MNFEEKAKEIVNGWISDPRELALLMPGTDIEPLLRSIASALSKAYEEGAREENEACAKIAEDSAKQHQKIADEFSQDVALVAQASALEWFAQSIRSRATGKALDEAVAIGQEIDT